MDKLPHVLLAVYVALTLLFSSDPVDTEIWAIGTLVSLSAALVLVLTYKKFRFSNTSYLILSVVFFMYAIGNQYLFQNVPFDFVTELFGFSRNHYDRVAHLMVGLCAYPVAELYFRTRSVTSRWTGLLFAFMTIAAVAAIFEIMEWWFVVLHDPKATLDLIGAQGDIWDTQKDMMFDAIGALFGVFFYHIKNKGLDHYGRIASFRKRE